jgi:hypothetical protein
VHDSTASNEAYQENKDTTDAHVAKIDAGLAAAVESISEVDAKVDAAVAKLNAKIKAEAEEAEAAAAQEVEVAASWQYLANPIHPTNRREAVHIELGGKNFGQYDYTPLAAPFFECTFTLSTDNSSTIVTAGQTLRTKLPDDEPWYTVICPSPVSIEKKAIFQLSVVWLGREDPVAIPFNGAEKKDLITVDMTWSALNSANNRHLIADVDGLDADKKYTCKFTQADNEDITKSADGAFLGEKGRKMDCGAQPTGFAISDDNTAAVVFELFVKGTKTKASYAGPIGGGPNVKLDTCKNGEKDGDETDDDCGGGCGGCPPNSVCKADDDCAGTVPCVDEVCGLDGLTIATAGKTCKAIVLQLKDSKNGFYWVRVLFD